MSNAPPYTSELMAQDQPEKVAEESQGIHTMQAFGTATPAQQFPPSTSANVELPGLGNNDGLTFGPRASGAPHSLASEQGAGQMGNSDAEPARASSTGERKAEAPIGKSYVVVPFEKGSNIFAAVSIWKQFEAEKVRRQERDAEGPAITTYSMVQSNLPLCMVRQEPEKHLYHEFLDIDAKEQFSLSSVYSYCGKDRWIFEAGSRKICASKPAMVHIRDRSQPDRCFGSLYNGHKGMHNSNVNNNVPIRVSFNPDTQRPAVCLKIKFDRLDEKRVATWACFANSMRRSTESIGIDYWAGKNPALFSDLLKDIRVREVTASGDLWRTDLSLNARDKQPETGAKGRPVWSGITPKEVQAFEQRFARGDSKLSPAEELIVLLNQTNSLSIYVHWPEEFADHLQFFWKYFRSISYAAANLGNFWWFKLALKDGRVIDERYPFMDLRLPKWMVTTWLVHYVDYEPISFKPLTCAKLVELRPEEYPDEDTRAFELRLGLGRHCSLDSRTLLEFTKDEGINEQEAKLL